MQKTKEGRMQYYFFIITMYLLIFQNFLQQYVEYFSYMDEILAILWVPVLLIYLLKNKEKAVVRKNQLLIFLLLVIIVISGIFGNMSNQYQSLNAIFTDILTMLKFFMIYGISSIIFTGENLNKFNKKISFHIKLLIVLFLILTVFNYAFNIFGLGELRFGIRTNELFYSHATYLASACAFLVTLNIMFERKIISKYNIIIFLILMSTLRYKAMIFGAAILILGFFIEKTNKKISFSKLGIVAVICLLITLQQIEYYFIEIEDSARASLLRTSITIANDKKPIGTGFATFGSDQSGKSYSAVYSDYGIHNIYGLEEGRAYFISDSFWPMILGQFGYLGFVSYAIILIIMFKNIQNEYTEENKYAYIAKIGAFMYLIISSTSESAFVNPSAVMLAILLGINMKKEKNINEQ